MRLGGGHLFSSYIYHKANSSYVQESLDPLLKALYYSYLRKEILCAKLFFEEILFYLVYFIDPIVINGKAIDIVPKAKVLGLTLSSNLKWNNHVDEIVKKSRKRLYCLSQLKRSGIKPPELIPVLQDLHSSQLQSTQAPVFHECLPAYLSKDIESIQRCAMRISFPSLSYKEALDEAGLISLSVRRQSLTDKLFTKVTTDRRTNFIISYQSKEPVTTIFGSNEDSSQFLKLTVASQVL